MLQLTLASWRQHRRRYVATFLAIFLGVGFCAATLSMNAAAKKGAEDSVALQYSKTDVVVTPSGPGAGALADAISELSGVAAVAVVDTAYTNVAWPAGHATGTAQISEIPLPIGLRWQTLVSGHLPATASQVVVDAGVASNEDVGIGSTLAVGSPGSATVVTVVGLASSSNGAQGVSEIFAQAGALKGWHLPGTSRELDVLAANGVSQSGLAEAVREVAPAAAVQTAETLRQEAVVSLTNDVDVFAKFFEGFAIVSLFVAGLVIANTFRIVMAQRIKDLALLRCVGAQRWQVFVISLGEAALLGVVASLVAILAGLGSSLLLVSVLNRTSIEVPLTFVAPSTPTLALPFAGGVIMTLAAAMAPAWRAARVAPLAAMRPSASVTMRNRSGAFQVATGLVVGFVGSVLLGLAVVSGQLLPGLAGGLLTFLGVLALTPVVVPGAIRLIGRARHLLPRRWRGGVPADLSVLNAVRNPRRTAATAAALLVGVTLISTMSVGAASVSATEASALNRVAPVDLTVSGGAIPQGLAEAVADVPGVEHTATAQGLTAHTSAGVVVVAALSSGGAAEVIRDPSMRRELDDGSTMTVPSSFPSILPRGGTLPFSLRVGDASVRVRPVYSSLDSGPLLVSEATLEQLGGHPHAVALYVRVADGADPQSVVTAIRDVSAGTTSAGTLTVDGGFAERSTYDRTISVLLLLATALLGVAVLIALVGVGNTLTLSVLERTREHGLLRALGLTTAQLRMLLANEAVLMAGTAAVLGTALGIGYGWVGTLTLLNGTTTHAPTLAIPVARLALVIAVAVGAGLLASVIPARHAVRLTVSAALAED